MKIYFLSIVTILATLSLSGQGIQTQNDYREVVTKRAAKIVSALGISDSSIFNRVTNTIATQYVFLNEIQSLRDSKKKNVQDRLLEKAVAEEQIKNIELAATRQLDSLHPLYLNRLAQDLSPDQVEKVKDGMTYGVLPITYKGYQEMLPDLTKDQKATILSMLTEAREKAMDAGSSEEKHKWFGKYKGRINNYLSAQGYNMKKASEEWANKTRERNRQAAQNNK